MKILVIVHEDLVPPTDISISESSLNRKLWQRAIWKTEYDVAKGLRENGYQIEILGVGDSLAVIEEAVQRFKPNVVFNLLEEFAGEAIFDQNVVSYLEILGVPYTGSNPRGLILARDKALAKSILSYHKIPTAPFWVFKRNKKITVPKDVLFPCFVKTVNEEASLGITRKSIVKNAETLVRRIHHIQEKYNTDVIVEQYIDGREFYVGVVGNKKITTYPVWELFLDKAPLGTPNIATSRIKWDFDYRKKYGVRTGPAFDLSEKKIIEIQGICKKAYSVLGLSGYARMDLRMNHSGELFFLEANPNPDIGFKEDLSASAEAAGESYGDLLKKIVRLGIKWEPSQ